MNAYTDAIADIGETLVTLLNDGFREAELFEDWGDNDVVLASPEEIPNVSPRLCLFLYQVTENAYLKNRDMERIDNKKLKYPGLALDLYYLLIPYPKGEVDAATVSVEHKVLGKAMQIFHDNAILRDPVLRGGLRGKGLEIRLMLNTVSLDDITKLWHSFQSKSAFKLSACYIVSPVIIESGKDPKFTKLVKEEDLKFYGKIKKHAFLEEIIVKPDAVVFSVVDDFSGRNLANAKVSIKGTGLKPVKNNSGYYIFFKLTAGTYDYTIEAERFEKIIDKEIIVKEDEVSVNGLQYADKIIPVNLIPLPSYPFPNGTTLVRGEVFDEADKEPIEGAEVTLVLANRTIKAHSTKKGEFVIYFPKLNNADMISESHSNVKKLFMKSANANKDLVLEFTKEGYEEKDKKMLLIEEDKTSDIESFILEIGKEIRIKKYLTKKIT